MKRLLFFTALAAAACFDPLYEDGAPLTSSWVVCCSNFGEVGTCFCKEAATCQQSLYACSAGRCSLRSRTQRLQQQFRVREPTSN